MGGGITVKTRKETTYFFSIRVLTTGSIIECWGNYEVCDGEYDFAGRVRIINIYMTAVKICSEVDNLDAFDSMNEKLELLCKQHNCFTRNNEEELKFISFNEELFEDEEADSIDTKLSEINTLLFDFLDDYYSD